MSRSSPLHLNVTSSNGTISFEITEMLKGGGMTRTEGSGQTTTGPGNAVYKGEKIPNLRDPEGVPKYFILAIQDSTARLVLTKDVKNRAGVVFDRVYKGDRVPQLDGVYVPMVHDKLKRALARRYEEAKINHPVADEGRRARVLRVLYDSWTEDVESDDGMTDMTHSDPDPFDKIVEDDELGLIVRTDFTDDDAWNRFSQKVQASQEELLSELKTKDDSMPVGDASDSDSSSEEVVDILKIVDPPEQSDRLGLIGISNLTALRLFNDVDIRRAPRPTGFKPSYQNPLIDQGGWQEIYSGKQLWIYDSRSNSDECVRVVSQAGDFYGTATADSWRARASHICELQFSMTQQGLKIDFNGMDRWDADERTRNLAQAIISK